MPADFAWGLSPSAIALAETVSLAVRIEPQLLRKARLDLFPAADAGVEADVWFSQIVESHVPSGIVLRPFAAHALRERLSQRPADLESAWRVVEGMHRGISPALLAEERLAYLSLAGRYDEMRELLRSVVATLLSPRGDSLASWAARAIERLPAAARTSEEAQMLAFGACLRLGDASLLNRDTHSVQAAQWSSWLSPGELETVPFGVALLDGAVEFGPLGRPLAHRIEIPATTPILVALHWRDRHADGWRQIALERDSVSVVDTGPEVE